MEATARSTSPSGFGTPNSTDSTLNQASASAHSVVDSIAGKANEAANKAKPAIERVAARAHQVVDKAVGAAVPTADWLAMQGERLHTTQKKLVENSTNYVSANPLKSVGIAIAAGFLPGRIIR